MSGAGTDADVSVSLQGDKAGFGPYQLPASKGAFETGTTDTFRRERERRAGVAASPPTTHGTPTPRLPCFQCIPRSLAVRRPHASHAFHASHVP